MVTKNSSRIRAESGKQAQKQPRGTKTVKRNDSLPSRFTKDYWLYAERQTGAYPQDTDNVGKWLIFVKTDQADKTWELIKRATEEGKLGNSAKVSTRKIDPDVGRSDRHVICVYTYNWTDEADVLRIRQALRELGVTWKIHYKSDADTIAGKYASSGNERISKYSE